MSGMSRNDPDGKSSRRGGLGTDRQGMLAKSFGCAFLVAGLIWSCPVPLAAQDNDDCFFFCAPELKIEPTFTVENLFRRHRVAQIEGGIQVGIERAEREVVFETVVAVDIPTQIPRVGFTLEAIFAPFSSGEENPFSGRTAAELGRSSVGDNTPEIEIELNLEWLTGDDTGGWVGSHFDIIDKISPSERPLDASAYTHKLNFELDTGVNVFNWLSSGNWLRNIELEGSLDYVATGLPRAGDRLGDELFLDDASRWSFSLVFVIPLAPLSP